MPSPPDPIAGTPAAPISRAAGYAIAPARRRFSDLALGGWLALALVITLVGAAVVVRRPFDTEPHAWASAHFAMLAHSFNVHGVAALKGVPVHNHPPLGTQPDAYLHWPPLYPLILSFVFRVFGESEAVARGFTVAAMLVASLALFLLLRALAGARAGWLAAFAFLVSPVIVVFGRSVINLHFAVTFQLLGVLAFVHAVSGERIRRVPAVLGVAAMVSAVLCGWEPVLSSVGLLLASWMLRSRPGVRLGLVYVAACGLAVGGVLLLYVRAYPLLFADLWHTVLFRLGLGFQPTSELPIHAYVNRAVYGVSPGSPVAVAAILLGRHLELGAFGLIAIAGVVGFAARFRSQSRAIGILFGGLFVPWLLWLVLMWKHALFHEFELLLPATFAAACFGIGLSAVLGHLENAPAGSPARSLSWLAYLAVPAVMLVGALQVWRNDVLRSGPPTGLIEYAHDIRAATPENAVILSTESSLVPVYYSGRHLIRGIVDDATLARARQALIGVFPGSPVYVALRPEKQAAFPETLHDLRLVSRTAHVVLLEMDAP
jgi:hypothetical protein